jgi:hypothetical protein
MPARRDATPRHNFEGAFPLLLIGGALLIYAVVLANQEIGMHGSHLPLYGLVGGVGAVVAGAGLYSAFSVSASDRNATATSSASAPRLPQRGRGAPNATSRAHPKSFSPTWWEGPGEAPAPVRGGAKGTEVRVAPRPASTRSIPELASEVRAPGKSVADPQLSRPSPNADLLDQLAEIEAIAQEMQRRSPRRSARPALKGVMACCDCDAPMDSDPAPNFCPECHRRLCVDCALASSLEDGELRCLECRERSAAGTSATF